MQNQKIVVGLDIGTTKICAIVARKNEHGKVEVLGLGKAESLGVQRGVVTNIEKTTSAIAEAVKAAEADVEKNVKGEFKVRIGEVFVGIAGQHIRSLQNRGIRTRVNVDDEISLSDITALMQDMQRIALEPGHEIIDVLPQFYTVDNEHDIKDPIGMAGVRLEGNFHIITGQITAANNIRKCVTKAGLGTRSLFLEPLASAAAVLSDEELEGGVCLVDIGGGTTDIAIFHDGIIRHTAIIPIAGRVITEDIKTGLQIMTSQAELLKTNYGCAIAAETSDNEFVSIKSLRDRPNREISLRNLAKIIEARVSEIIDLVHYEIKAAGLEKKLIGGIVLTGGGSMLKHLAQLVEYRTGLLARVGYPNEHLSKGYVDEIQSPMYATGVGLILKGFQDYVDKEIPKVVHEEIIEEKETKPKERSGLFAKFNNLGSGLTRFLRDDDGDSGVDDFK